MLTGNRLLRALLRGLLIAVTAPGVGASQTIADRPSVAFVEVESPAKRLRYLATAQIWSDPGDVTPEALAAGPPLRDASGIADAVGGRAFPCTFASAGKTLGGNTLKFRCTTETGHTIGVKYTDESRNGNREVFSAVAASRLLWALGFNADPVYPITLDCRGCPADPMAGTGPAARRSYLAVYQPGSADPVMVAGLNPNQGWRWGEIDRAIETLPAGELRSRQRQHFDALTLVGVLLQHGDRKPEQQRLACRGGLNLEAGELRSPGGARGNVAVFFERAGSTACETPHIAVQDIGATFGGAGRRTNASTAKMNLESWAARPVFHPSSGKVGPGEAVECRGQLIVSIAAGNGSLAHPRIGEAGRQFLVEQLRRLTDDHLRAIFTAARVEQMSGGHPADAWIAAFKDKVRQIEERTCAP